MIPRLRIRSARPGLPPLLIIQAGPGVPLFHEIPRFQKLLGLEDHFTVYYWDQRGCGNTDLGEAGSVTLGTQEKDLSNLLGELNRQTGRPLVLLGISLGASLALRAASRDPSLVASVLAVSPDLDVPSADLFIWESLGKPERLGPPPYLTPARFQHRMRLVADRRSIERNRRFLQILGGTLVGLVRTYGIPGALRSLRNMTAVQGALLPALAEFHLDPGVPGGTVPVHYLFGAGDLLCPPSAVGALRSRLLPTETLTVVPEAGHLVHFDAPGQVRNLLGIP